MQKAAQTLGSDPDARLDFINGARTRDGVTSSRRAHCQWKASG